MDHRATRSQVKLQFMPSGNILQLLLNWKKKKNIWGVTCKLSNLVGLVNEILELTGLHPAARYPACLIGLEPACPDSGFLKASCLRGLLHQPEGPGWPCFSHNPEEQSISDPGTSFNVRDAALLLSESSAAGGLGGRLNCQQKTGNRRQ